MSEHLLMDPSDAAQDPQNINNSAETNKDFLRVLAEAGVADFVEPFGADGEISTVHPTPEEMPSHVGRTQSLVSYEKGMPIDD